MTIEYLDLADYIAIAAAVTGLDVATLMKVTSLDLADSAESSPSGRHPGIFALADRLAREGHLPATSTPGGARTMIGTALSIQIRARWIQ